MIGYLLFFGSVSFFSFAYFSALTEIIKAKKDFRKLKNKLLSQLPDTQEGNKLKKDLENLS